MGRVRPDDTTVVIPAGIGQAAITEELQWTIYRELLTAAVALAGTSRAAALQTLAKGGEN